VYLVQGAGSFLPFSGIGTTSKRHRRTRKQLSPSLAGDVTTPILVAQSPHIHFVDNAAPVHPRVLPGAVAGDYVVAWTTSAAARKPTLKWGTQSGSYPNVAVATTAQLPIGALCGPPATTTGFMDLGVTASVALHGLASVYAGLRIHYILADGDGRVSGDFSFVVPAPRVHQITPTVSQRSETWVVVPLTMGSRGASMGSPPVIRRSI